MTHGVVHRCAPVMVAGLLMAVAGAARAQSCIPGEDVAAVRAEGVAGGGTIALAGGQEVRLSGIVVPAGSPHGAAARAALAKLITGHKVIVARAGRADRHGRILADVFAGSAAPVMAQEVLVAAGLARVAPIKDNPACTKMLLAAEDAARRARIGVWQDAAFAIRAADRPDELTSLTDTFQIVEGRIVSTGATRARAYLNFGKSWKSDFTGIIAAGDLDEFLAAGLAPSMLAGRYVRVRGYLEADDGPLMRLRDPAQVELLEAR